MGLLHSGELADLCLYVRMEKPLLQVSTLDLHKVSCYFRFRDDILIVSRSRLLANHFFKRMQRLAGYFGLKLEACETQSITFLEIVVHKPPPIFNVVHNLKVDALRVPLSSTSSHSPYVHRSWPKSLASRIMRLCSSPKLMKVAHCTLINRLQESMADELTIRLASDASAISHEVCRPRSSHEHTLWLVLDYHPATCARFLSVVRNFMHQLFVVPLMMLLKSVRMNTCRSG